MNKLLVTVSPHIKSGRTVRSLMLDVVIALLPACAAAVVIFGPRALLVLLTCVVFSVLGEAATRKILKRPSSIGDFSAVITGILLALNLPVAIPLWMAALGSLVAIVIVKQLFGGIGQNFVNPAIAGRIVLMVSFPAAMTTWAKPFFYLAEGANALSPSVHAISSATPLAALAEGAELPQLLEMFLGIRSGSMGETCALALLIGFVYLLIRKVISPVIPLCFVGTTVLLTALAGFSPFYELLSGGLLLGAIFMATDYTTSPLTTKGKVIFGVGCGFITAVIRLFASLPEGVSYSILLMNILVPHIETLTTPRPFGEKEARAK